MTGFDILVHTDVDTSIYPFLGCIDKCEKYNPIFRRMEKNIVKHKYCAE